MRIPRIHTTGSLQAGSDIDLEPGPSAHLGRALRMGPGDALVLFNGDGYSYRGSLTAVSKKTVTVHIEHRDDINLESPLDVHLGIAISRGDRMDWVVQKATELGVAKITPLLTQRTGVKLAGERAAKKCLHWQQIAISACEQCGRNRVPEVGPLTELDKWLPQLTETRRFVLHHRATAAPVGMDHPDSLALLIGPEGGLSESEIGLAEQNRFEALALGPRVLRTETAPLAALTLLQARWGDMTSLSPS
jgi:16S rRNA (uracil1498-N3)-methyltransferase